MLLCTSIIGIYGMALSACNFAAELPFFSFGGHTAGVAATYALYPSGTSFRQRPATEASGSSPLGSGQPQRRLGHQETVRLLPRAQISRTCSRGLRKCLPWLLANSFQSAVRNSSHSAVTLTPARQRPATEASGSSPSGRGQPQRRMGLQETQRLLPRAKILEALGKVSHGLLS